MYYKVLTVVAACLYYSGLVRLGRWWTRRLGPQVIILNYHAVDGGNLRAHLLYLRRYYRILHLEEALEELYHPSSPPTSDRRTPLVITFDDGYIDNYTHAFALASELQVPITLFLIPGYIETGARFWWLEPAFLLSHANVSQVTLEGQTYHLHIPSQRAALTQLIDQRIRFAPSVDERESFLTEIRQLLAVPDAVSLLEKSSLPFSWQEVEAMKDSQWVSFGAHTIHHPILAYLTDPREAEFEVSQSRTELEKHLQSPVRCFAYPVGKYSDIEQQGINCVQKAGFTWAVTTIRGMNTPQSNPYLLHRLGINVQHHWLIIAAKISGVGRIVSRMWNLPMNLVRMPIRLFQSLAK
jgi:peptidoglycan/xylan/chitin deacetylase (PgdA/CDA1 family)